MRQQSAAAAEVTVRTVIDGLMRPDGTAALSEVYDVGVMLGFTDQQVRLTIRRLVAAGRATQEGRGRKGILARGRQADVEERHDARFVRLAYAQDAGLAPWDGWWHLMSFSIPEPQRDLRDALRRTILRLGAAHVHGGLYVSAHPLEGLVRAESRDAVFAASTVFASTRDFRTHEASGPRELAALLWPLDEVAARYRQLDRANRSAAARLPELSGAPRGHMRTVGLVSIALRLAAAFDAAMAPDPLLPPELLGDRWPGREARARFRTTWQELRDLRSGEPHALFARFQ